jgi:uncharacterized protein
MAAPRSLSGLRALVTGASSGIGASLSRLLIDAGAAVVGCGRNTEALARVPFAATITRELCDPGAPGDVVKEAADALGGNIDVVVSGAGAGWTGAFADLPADELDHLLDINLRVPMHLARAAAAYLLESEAGGQLVLVGSIAGLVGVAEEVAYATAKSGLRGLADSLRAEWGSRRLLASHPGTRAVTVTLVSPGPVDTAFFSRRNQPYQRTWPRPAPADKVAGAIVAAIENRREDVVVPSWLGLAARLNGGLPAFYRWLTRAQEHLPA